MPSCRTFRSSCRRAGTARAVHLCRMLAAPLRRSGRSACCAVHPRDHAACCAVHPRDHAAAHAACRVPFARSRPAPNTMPPLPRPGRERQPSGNPCDQQECRPCRVLYRSFRSLATCCTTRSARRSALAVSRAAGRATRSDRAGNGSAGRATRSDRSGRDGTGSAGRAALAVSRAHALPGTRRDTTTPLQRPEPVDKGTTPCTTPGAALRPPGARGRPTPVEQGPGTKNSWAFLRTNPGRGRITTVQTDRMNEGDAHMLGKHAYRRCQRDGCRQFAVSHGGAAPMSWCSFGCRQREVRARRRGGHVVSALVLA